MLPPMSQGPRAFQNPVLRRFALARLCTTVAIHAYSVVVGWQLFAWTHDPLLLGLLGFAQFTPMALLSPFAGSLVDRRSRRDLAALSILGCALALFALLLATRHGGRSVWAVMTVATAFGAVRAFAGPSLSALVPELVSADELPRALAMVSSVFQFALVAGPALGGFVFAQFGATFTYGSGVLLLLCATGLILSLPRRNAPRPSGDARDVWAGLRFVRKKRVLLGAMSLDLFAVLLGGAVALLPAIAQDVLHVGPEAFGWLRSAPALGAVLMGVILSRWPIERRVGAYMLGAVFVFGLSTVGFGLSRTFLLSLALLFVSGASDMVSVVLRHSLIQLETPDHMRGRVSAVSQLFIGASNELGELESGATAAWFGLTWAILLGGAGTLLVVLLWALVFPELRRADRLRSAPA
jgi:MFS family permease